jgi:hypothetical protein
VGDRVRISKAKRTFEKGYLPKWTTELFTISRKVPGLNAYGIEDDHGEELEGTFYAKELQQVVKTDDVYEVEEVLAYKNDAWVRKSFLKSKCVGKGTHPVLTHGFCKRISFCRQRPMEIPRRKSPPSRNRVFCSVIPRPDPHYHLRGDVGLKRSQSRFLDGHFEFLGGLRHA